MFWSELKITFFGAAICSIEWHVRLCVDAVASWPTPTYVRKVQGFLGLAIFYRCFVKGLAAITKSLTDLTKKAIEFKWEAEEGAAFEALKKALMNAPILQVFDEVKPHEVWVDASACAVGATLVQPSEDERPGCQWSTCHTSCQWQNKTTMPRIEKLFPS